MVTGVQTCALPIFLVKELLYSGVLMLGAITFGYVLAYPSPAIPSMEEEMDLSEFEKTYFNSISSLFAIVGPFITSFLLKFTGRKSVTFIVAVSGCAFWCLVFLTREECFWFGMIGRALLGLVMGGFSHIVPMYIVELAPEGKTGFFGSLNQLAVAFGIVVVYFVGTFLEWFETAVVGCFVCLLMAILLWFIPESPAVAESKSQIVQKESVFQKKYLKPLVVSIFLMFFQQFSGINAILTNLTQLFKDAGITIEPGIASTISASAQVISVLCGGFLVEFMGRKIAWGVSLGGMSLALILHTLSFKIKMPNWLPIIIVFLFLLFFGLGAGPLPWFYVSEQFGSSVRAQASSVVSSSNWIFVFIVISVYPSLKDAIHEFGCFLIFAIISIVGTIFGLVNIKKDAGDINLNGIDEKIFGDTSLDSKYN